MNPEEVLRSHARRAAPPVRLQAAEVLATARRRVRRGRITMVAAAGVAAVLVLAGVALAAPGRRADDRPAVVPSRPPEPLHCTAAAIPAPPGVPADGWAVAAIDPTGRYIVGGPGSWPSTVGLLLWTDGVPSRPAAASEFEASAVNRDGTVAGAVHPAGGEPRAALFRGGAVVPLPLPSAASRSEATAVNARGDAVGYAILGSSVTVGLIWPAGGGFVLPAAGEGRTGLVAGVTDNGVVAGRALTASTSGADAYRWGIDGGPGVPLAKGTAGAVTAVGGDWAAGTAPLTSPPDPDDFGPWHARWSLRTGAVEPLGHFVPAAVSAAGTVLGRSSEHATGLSVWHDGAVTALPPLNPDHALVWHAGVTADGATIVASLTGGRGGYDNVRWTC